MAVFLSPVGGVAAQFFTNTGAVLTGGKLYTYAAGTTTPAVTFTSSGGTTFNPNPVVLDAAGRVPNSGEIWLSNGVQYKFVLKDSNDVLIATYDNINGINSDFTNFLANQEIQTATAGQTVFTLANAYTPGANTLSVFVDGVNQYGPGATYAYYETNANTVTFVSGLHVGASVKFTTVQSLTSTQATTAALVSYTEGGTGAVATNVQSKLRETVSVKDFGAVGDGVTNDTAAIQAAIDSFGNTSANTAGSIYFPKGTYKVSSQIVLNGQTGFVIFGQGKFLTTIVASNWTDNTKPIFKFVNGAYCSVKEMSLNAQSSGTQVKAAIEIQVSAPISPTPQGMIFENLHIDGVQSGGFSCGIRFFADAGQDNNNERAFFNNCDFSNCSNGISIENYNSLLHQIFGGVIGSCGVGINTSIGLGGSFSATGVSFIQNSIADFKFANNDTHPIDIVNCKSEATTGYWIWTTNAATRDDINVVNSTYHGTTTGAGCILYAGKGHLNLNNCDIYTTGTQNTIITNNANSSLNIIGCNIYSLASVNWSGNLFMAGNKYVDGTATTIIPGTPKSLVYLDKNINVSTGIYTVTVSSYAWNNNPIINSVIANFAGTVTLVLPNPALYFGLVLNVRTITANTVISDTSNVVPITGGAAGTAILPATAGAWATLQSNGTSWITMTKG